jgi:predicted metal-dependent hydrolase
MTSNRGSGTVGGGGPAKHAEKGGEAAKRRFKARTLEWATRLDVNVRSITVRPLTTKWASCSTAGRLTFDSQLPELSSELQDYVIVHELLHFSVPNHGRLWKTLMRTHLGSYEDHEKKLREIAGGVRPL